MSDDYYRRLEEDRRREDERRRAEEERRREENRRQDEERRLEEARRRDEDKKREGQKHEYARQDQEYEQQKAEELWKRAAALVESGNTEAAAILLGLQVPSSPPPRAEETKKPEQPAKAGRDEHTPRTPTAGEQFRKHSGKLLFYLQWSEALPATLRQEWVASVERLDIEQPTASLAILTEVSESYKHIQHLEPPASDFYHATRWIDQVPRIGHEISWLLDILNHVLAINRSRKLGGRGQEWWE